MLSLKRIFPNKLNKFSAASLLIVGLCVLPSCKDDQASADAEKEEAERREAAIREANEKAEKEAQKAKERELAAKKKEEERIAAEKAEQERLLAAEKERERKAAEEKVRLYEEKMERLHRAQKLAWKSYVGTKYDSLKLNNGKKYNKVSVIAVTVGHVEFMHEHGIAKEHFAELNSSIRVQCNYDEHVEKYINEKNQRIAAEESARRAKEAKNRPPRTASKSPTPNTVRQPQHVTPKPTVKKKPTEPRKVTPKGNVTVRVVGTRRGSARGKTIKITVSSNVEATLHVNRYTPYYYHYLVRIGKNQSFTGYTHTGNKYSVELRSKDGKLLDKETHLRKSGL